MAFIDLPTELQTFETSTEGRTARFALQTFEGVVSDVQLSNSTHVSASGGGGSISTTYGQVHGRIDPINVSSTTTQHMTVFVTSPNDERPIYLDDSPVSFRRGNGAMIHYVGEDKPGGDLPFYAILNADQDRMLRFDAALDAGLKAGWGFSPDYYRDWATWFWFHMLGRAIATFSVGTIAVGLVEGFLPQAVVGLLTLGVLGWTGLRLVTGTRRFVARKDAVAAARATAVAHVQAVNRWAGDRRDARQTADDAIEIPGGVLRGA